MSIVQIWQTDEPLGQQHAHTWMTKLTREVQGNNGGSEVKRISAEFPPRALLTALTQLPCQAQLCMYTPLPLPHTHTNPTRIHSLRPKMAAGWECRARQCIDTHPRRAVVRAGCQKRAPAVPTDAVHVVRVPQECAKGLGLAQSAHKYLAVGGARSEAVVGLPVDIDARGCASTSPRGRREGVWAGGCHRMAARARGGGTGGDDRGAQQRALKQRSPTANDSIEPQQVRLEAGERI